MTEYVVQECSNVDCEIKEPHWVVFHDESGVGISDHFSEDEANAECDRLNA